MTLDDASPRPPSDRADVTVERFERALRDDLALPVLTAAGGPA